MVDYNAFVLLFINDQAFEAEVSVHSNAIVSLDNTGHEMISQGHYASDTIKKRLKELHRLWELLLSRLAEKGLKEALVLVQFLRSCDGVLLWITDKETFVTADEFGTDLDHVEVEGVERDLAARHDKVNTLGAGAERLCAIHGDHAEQIRSKHEEVVENWEELVEKAKVCVCICSIYLTQFTIMV